MNNYFKGRYYKHQKDGFTLCVIIGTSNQKDFIQIITNEEVFYYPSHKECVITNTSLSLNLPEISGFIEYGSFTPLSASIMGPFHHLPLQCKHEILSMSHTLTGQFRIHKQLIDFHGGTGYIEGDYGRSFPQKYMWLHCNDFSSNLSIMVAVAHIPMVITSFAGCICAIVYNNKEYRLATYKGVTIIENRSSHLHLKQGHFDLSIHIKPSTSHPLKAPHLGEMNQVIYESNCSEIDVTFTVDNHILFHEHSKGASYERRE